MIRTKISNEEILAEVKDWIENYEKNVFDTYFPTMAFFNHFKNFQRDSEGVFFRIETFQSMFKGEQKDIDPETLNVLIRNPSTMVIDDNVRRGTVYEMLQQGFEFTQGDKRRIRLNYDNMKKKCIPLSFFNTLSLSELLILSNYRRGQEKPNVQGIDYDLWSDREIFLSKSSYQKKLEQLMASVKEEYIEVNIVKKGYNASDFRYVYGSGKILFSMKVGRTIYRFMSQALNELLVTVPIEVTEGYLRELKCNNYNFLDLHVYREHHDEYALTVYEEHNKDFLQISSLLTGKVFAPGDGNGICYLNKKGYSSDKYPVSFIKGIIVEDITTTINKFKAYSGDKTLYLGYVSAFMTSEDWGKLIGQKVIVQDSHYEFQPLGDIRIIYKNTVSYGIESDFYFPEFESKVLYSENLLQLDNLFVESYDKELQYLYKMRPTVSLFTSEFYFEGLRDLIPTIKIGRGIVHYASNLRQHIANILQGQESYFSIVGSKQRQISLKTSVLLNRKVYEGVLHGPGIMLVKVNAKYFFVRTLIGNGEVIEGDRYIFKDYNNFDIPVLELLDKSLLLRTKEGDYEMSLSEIPKRKGKNKQYNKKELKTFMTKNRKFMEKADYNNLPSVLKDIYDNDV